MEKIGKKPVALNREALGFIGNRLQPALLREALYIVESLIATKEAVDTAVKCSPGRRPGVTGPLETSDPGGLDIFYNISSYLLHDLCNSTGVASSLKGAIANAIYDLTDPMGQKEVEMKEQREILKQKVMELVKNFIEIEGGVSMFDLQILFGNPVESVGCNELCSALRLNGFSQMAQIYRNPG